MPLKKIKSNFKSSQKEKPDPNRLHQKELPNNGKRSNSNLRKILQEGKRGEHSSTNFMKPWYQNLRRKSMRRKITVQFHSWKNINKLNPIVYKKNYLSLKKKDLFQVCKAGLTCENQTLPITSTGKNRKIMWSY